MAGSILGLLMGFVLAAAAHSQLAQGASLNTSVRVYTLCNTRKYESGDAFGEEIDAALTALKQKASTGSRYYYYAPKHSAATVMAAFQCRGDLPADACSGCVNDAANDALSSCPRAIGSRVQLDGCFLRYENYSFAVEDTGIVVELCNTKKNADPHFLASVSDLLARVTRAAPRGKLLYASDSAALSATNASAPSHLYALAQCLGYLSPAECSNCLSAHSSSWKDCDNAVGAQIHSVSCYYRYEIYPFYYM